MWKSHETPNPLTPFPTREGGKFKVSLLLGERFRERFSRYREKSDMTQDIVNKLFGEKGYISHKLFSVHHHVFPPIRV
jgi:hypothetical protein